MSTPEKTGWPAPELMQDDSRPLFRWLASKPDARRLVRSRAEEICCARNGHNCDQGRKCPDRKPSNFSKTEMVVWGATSICIWTYVLVMVIKG